MKKIVILLLILVFAASVGCSEKREPVKKSRTKTAVKRELAKGAKKGILIDPVSKNPVDIMESPYSYIYKDVEYNFQTKENMEAFMKEPERYIAELEALLKE